MSTFIRRYSRYLNEKSLACRLIALDITKTKRGSVDTVSLWATMITDPGRAPTWSWPNAQPYFRMLMSPGFLNAWFQACWVSFLFCRMDGMMRTLDTKQLLNTLLVIQIQFDALLNFNVRALWILSTQPVNDVVEQQVGEGIVWNPGGNWWLFHLINFQANPDEVTNGVMHAAFTLLFKDSLRLFAAYNEGILNLLGRLKNKHCWKQ